METNPTDFSYLDLPVARKEVNPIEKTLVEIRKNTKSPNKQIQGGEFSVDLSDVNNRAVDNRLKTFDNTTPFLDVYKQLNSGEVISKYETYVPRIDNDELLAQNQSWTEKAYNGTVKAGTNFLTTVLGNTAGFVYGVGAMTAEGNFNSLFDNSYTRTLDDLNTKLNYQLPNYVTKDNQKAGFFSNLWNDPANTVFNDVFNGVSFTLGTITSEAIWAAATGGASLAARAGQWGAKLANAGRIGRAVEAIAGAERVAQWGKNAIGAENAIKGLSSFKGILSEPIVNMLKAGQINVQTAKNLARGAEVLNTARFMATSSGNEAGLEAFHYKKEAEENFYQDFKDKNGREPSTEETSKALKEIDDASTWVFGGNMAILSVSNLAMLGNTFGIATPFKGLQKSIDRTLYGVGAEKVGESWAKIDPNKWQKVARKLAVPVGSLMREGNEEGVQGVITKMANTYTERKYDPKYINKATDMMEIGSKAFAEQYGTAQGMKEFWIGGLTGIIGSSFTKEFSHFKEADKEVKEGEVKALNSFDNLRTTLVDDISAKRITVVAQQLEAQDRADKSMTKGDIVQAKLAHYDGLIAGMMLANKYDSTDNLIENLSNGITASQDISQEEKNTFVEGLQKLNATFKEADSFASAIVGSQGRVKGTIDGTTQEVKEALTSVLVQGNNSNQMMKETFEEIKSHLNTVHTDAMELQSKLDGLSGRQKIDINRMQSYHTKLKIQRDDLVDKIRVLNERPNETQGDVNSGLFEAQEKLRFVENKIRENEDKAKDYAEKISQNNKFKDVLEANKDSQVTFDSISYDKLLTLNVDLENLNKEFNSMQELNPAHAQMLGSLLDRYHGAKKAMVDYNHVANLLAKGEFNLRLANDAPFAKKLGFIKQDERTQSFYNDLKALRTQKFLDLADLNQVRDAEKIKTKLENLAQKENLTEEELQEKADLTNQLRELQPLTANQKRVRQEELKKEFKDATEERQAEIDSELSQLEKETPLTKETVEGTVNYLRNEFAKETDAEKQNELSKLLEKWEAIDVEKLDSVKDDTPSVEGINLQEVAKLEEKLKSLQEEFVSTPEKLELEKTPPLNDIDGTYKYNDEEWTVKNGEIELKEGQLIPLSFVQEPFIDKLINQGKKVSKESNTSIISRIEETLSSIVGSNTLFDWSEDQPGKKIRGEFIPDNLGEQMFMAMNKVMNGEVEKVDMEESKKYFKELAKKIHPDKHQDPFIKIISEKFFKASTLAKNKGYIDVLKKIEKSFDEEIENQKANPIVISEENTVLEELPIIKPNPRKKELEKEIAKTKKQIESLKPTQQTSVKSPLEQLEERVENILDSQDVEYIGNGNLEERIKNRPDPKDVDRYRELQDNNEENTEEFQELKTKLSNWKILDSLSDDNMESVASILDKITSLKQTVEEEQTNLNPEILDDEQEITSDFNGGKDSITNHKLTDNPNYAVSFKIREDSQVELTKMFPQSLVDMLNGTNIRVNDVATNNLKNLKKGDVIRFDTVSGEVKVTVDTAGKLVLSSQDLLKVPGLAINTVEAKKTTNWNYIPLQEMKIDANGIEVSVPIKSDFFDEQILGHTNDLEAGDTVQFLVDVNNEFNKELLQKFKDKKIKVDELEDQVVIYVKKGDLYFQQLKAYRGKDKVSDTTIVDIRKRALKQIKTGKSGVIGQTTVERVELGVPILNLSKNGVVRYEAITQQGIESIVTTGYIQNGELFLSSDKVDKEKVRKSYVSKASRQNKDKKTPIVIIKQGKQLIAFPIRVVKSTNSQGERMLEIFNNSDNPVVDINNLLAENKINPKKFQLTNINQTETLNAIEEVLNQVESFKTADDFADKYDKKNLENDAEIAIDLTNPAKHFPSQKLLISFEDVNLNNTVAVEDIQKEQSKNEEKQRKEQAKKEVEEQKNRVADIKLQITREKAFDKYEEKLRKEEAKLKAIEEKEKKRQEKAEKEKNVNPKTKAVNSRNIKQDKETVVINIANETVLEEVKKSKKLVNLDLKVGENIITTDKEEAKTLKRYSTTKKQTVSKITVKQKEDFTPIEIDENNVEEIIKVDESLTEKRAQEIANIVFKSGVEVLTGNMLEDYKKDAGYINKLAKEKEVVKIEPIQGTPKKAIEQFLPNISIDFSEIEVGATTNVYQKEDGNWYFVDSNKREQKELQKNQTFLNWLHENIGNNSTITNQGYKEKREEFKAIQEQILTEFEIKCK